MSEQKQNRPDLGPPPRWLKCPRKGTVILDKFIAFKTPLEKSYQIADESTFPPSMLIQSLNSQKIKIGCWIDLTNTKRFYDSSEIEKEEIKYVKLQCRGHGECPSEEQTARFIRICHQFISQNPLEIIGVHCTHGFNRTGFLIVSYLVENLSWSVDAAVRCFSESRPPGIYKQDYLNELFKRYGDITECPKAPELPDWCDESDDEDDEGNRLEKNGIYKSHTKPPPHKRRKMMQNLNPVFMEGIPGVLPVSDLELVSKIQRRCQNMCGFKGSGFPGLQPVSMDIKNITYLHEKPYKVSWKADGTRYMMLIDGEDKVYFIDRDNCVFKVKDLRFPRRKAPDQHVSDTLLDGEMIIDQVNGKDHPRYLAYDIIKFEKNDVGKCDFSRRLLCINKEIVGPRCDALQSGKLDPSIQPFSVRLKDFWEVDMSRKILADKFCQGMSHEVDGLIFQPSDDPYSCGRCPFVLKWKPSILNSVDFKLKIDMESGMGILRKKICRLYVGGLDQPFSTMKFTKVLKDLNNKIIECKYEDNEWVFMRERTDKSFPNALKTAKGVCDSIKHPITTELLLHHIDHYRYRLMPPPPAKPLSSEQQKDHKGCAQHISEIHASTVNHLH